MKISKLNIEDDNGSLLSSICDMEDKINEVIDSINIYIKKEPIMTEKNEKLLDSILTRGLSIVDKFMAKIDEKLDDEEFMEKLSDKVEIEIDKASAKKETIHWNELPDKEKDKFKKMFDEWQWTKKR